MLNLIMSQLMAILKQNGFDGEKAQAQISEAIADLKAMKESQDRCEAMLRRLLNPIDVTKQVEVVPDGEWRNVSN